MWWKDLKWKIIIAVTILVILGIIIGKLLLTCYIECRIFIIIYHIGSIVGTQVK